MAELAADRVQQAFFALPTTPAAGPHALRVVAIACPNHLCGQLHVTATMHTLNDDGSGNLVPVDQPVRNWDMLPGPQAKELPPYVPEAAAREFAQATQVMSVSPNAAATLARRCLQALVRDFFEVKGKVLSEELDMIRDRVDTETWEAIEAVRQAGNIELHFERGVSVMADTDAEEPKLLLGLIEYLVENWYVARRRRQQRLATIKNLAPAESTSGSPRMSRRPPGASRRPPADSRPMREESLRQPPAPQPEPTRELDLEPQQDEGPAGSPPLPRRPPPIPKE